ncbi:hypothetical protein [Saccharothrix xinjiangensis]|uniref:Uncharacterized protein n=1 Tax=Saccharothrix xinjiangensis TaxID=204798 RepID=A0ABV9Y5C3_9PSEU
MSASVAFIGFAGVVIGAFIGALGAVAGPLLMHRRETQQQYEEKFDERTTRTIAIRATTRIWQHILEDAVQDLRAGKTVCEEEFTEICRQARMNVNHALDECMRDGIWYMHAHTMRRMRRSEWPPGGGGGVNLTELLTSLIEATFSIELAATQSKHHRLTEVDIRDIEIQVERVDEARRETARQMMNDIIREMKGEKRGRKSLKRRA